MSKKRSGVFGNQLVAVPSFSCEIEREKREFALANHATRHVLGDCLDLQRGRSYCFRSLDFVTGPDCDIFVAGVFLPDSEPVKQLDREQSERHPKEGRGDFQHIPGFGQGPERSNVSSYQSLTIRGWRQ